MSRLGKLSARLSTAASNSVKLISGGWKRIPDNERKTIKRALLALAVVIVIGGLGFLILRMKPKRAFSAALACRTIQAPGPLETTVHYGARELRLWKYSGEVNGLSSSSTKPSPPPGGSEHLTLQLTQKPRSEAQLKITVEAHAGQDLALSSPAGAIVTFTQEASPPSGTEDHKSLAELILKSGGNAESTASWQVDGSAEMWLTGLDVTGLGGGLGAQSNTVSLVPVQQSLIQFDFNTKEPGAKVLIGFPRRESPVNFRLRTPAEPTSFSFAECNGKEVTFDGFLGVPVGDGQDVGFDRATIKKFELTLTDTEPLVTVSIDGETHDVNLHGYSKNPSMLVGILSGGWDTRSVFGVIVVGLLLFLGKVTNRAIDVLAEVIIPDPPEKTKDTPPTESEEKGIDPASAQHVDGGAAKGNDNEVAPKP